METYNIVSKYEDYQIPIQILKLKDSYFIYVGSSQFTFNNLIVSTPSELNSNSFTIYDEEYSDVGKSLSDKLTMKFKCPFYLSFNLPDEVLTLNRGFYFKIEKDIIETISSLK